MRATCYLRIARTGRGYRFTATTKPTFDPLRAGYDALPTVMVRLNLELPADAFNPIDGVADVVIGPAQLAVLVEAGVVPEPLPDAEPVAS